MNVRGRALRAAAGCIAIAGADAVYCRRLLQSLRAGNEMRPIATMAVSDDLPNQLAASLPSIILFDLGPDPDTRGLTVVSAVSGVAKTIVLAGTGDDALAVGALNAGAAGFGPRDTPSDVLRRGIQIVEAGEMWVGRRIMVSLIEELAARSPAACAVAGAERLTPRERDLVSLVAKGASNKDIAQRLSISVKTVKTHLSSIFRKLGLSTRLELALAVGRSTRTSIG